MPCRSLARNLTFGVRCVQGMVFMRKMNTMNDVPFFGQNFNTWFPLSITVYCGLLLANMWERVVSKLFIASRYRFDGVSHILNHTHSLTHCQTHTTRGRLDCALVACADSTSCWLVQRLVWLAQPASKRHMPPILCAHIRTAREH